MSLDWSTIEETIASIVSQCTTVNDVYWFTDQNHFHDDKYIELEKVSFEEQHEDSRLYEMDGETMNASQVGQRLLSIDVKCFSEKATAYGAYELLSKLRTAIYKPSISEQLHSINISVASFGPIRSTNIESDGRMLNAAACEVQFNLTDILDDGQEGYVKQVAGTYPLQNEEIVSP